MMTMTIYLGKITIMLCTMLIICMLPASAQDPDSNIIQYLNSYNDPDEVALALIPYLGDSDPDVRISALIDIILTESKRPEVLQAEQKLLYSEPAGEFRDLLELGIEVSGGITYAGAQSPVAKTSLVIGSIPRRSTFESSITTGYSSTGYTSTGSTPMSSQGSYSPKGSEGGCYTDPATGEIVCVDSYGEPSEFKGGMSGGCYADPMTGQIICVDSYGETSSQQGGMQGGCYQDPDTGEIICVD